jgi:hypothetical protein
VDAGRRLRRATALALHPDAAIVGVWLVLGVALASLTYRVADWFKVPDEIVFERLGLSIAHDHSLVPRIHGEFIRSLAQLYPLLISPILAGGYIANDLPHVRVLNAIVVTSAFIPAYLLALRVTGRRWAAYLVGLLSVCLPWIVLASFLLTEVVALPAFLWAILAIQHALVRPSWRSDALALVAVAVAFFARTQFLLLLAVLPLAAIAYSVPRTEPQRLRERVAGTARATFASHRLLAAAYGAALVAAVSFVAVGGHLLSLSIYGEQFSRNPTPTELIGWGLGHLAALAFAVGILPFVVGAGWLLATVVRPAATAELQAFACLATAAILVTTTAVTNFDLQLGGFIFDRYLFYLVPLVVLAFVCALVDERLPRWSPALPAAAVAIGFTLHLQQSFTWTDPRVNTDAPAARFYEPLVNAVGSRGAAAAALAAASVVLALVFAAVAPRVRRDRLAAVLLTLLALGLPAETGYVFYRLYSTNGWADRPLTASNAGVLDWIDRTVGTNPSVTIVPAPVSSDYLVTQRYWRDIEFWNKSVARHLLYPGPGAYAYTGYWFPKLVARFDPATGAMSSSPTRYVVQSLGEARLRIAGTVIQQKQESMLIDAARPWRLAWLTSGLSTDGWTRSGATARIRVYASGSQKGAVEHFATLHLRAPGNVASRPARIATNLERRRVDVTPGGASVDRLLVCVPAGGSAEIRIDTIGSSKVTGDERTIGEWMTKRTGSVLVSGIFISDDIGQPCVPKAP